MPIMHDYMDIGGTSPWMDKGRIMQEQLSTRTRSGILLVLLVQRIGSGQQECRKDELGVVVIAPCLYDFESLST